MPVFTWLPAFPHWMVSPKRHRHTGFLSHHHMSSAHKCLQCSGSSTNIWWEDEWLDEWIQVVHQWREIYRGRPLSIPSSLFQSLKAQWKVWLLSLTSSRVFNQFRIHLFEGSYKGSFWVKHSGKRPSWLQKRPCLCRLCSVFSKLLRRQAVPPGNDLPIQMRLASKAQGRLAEVSLLPNPGVEATGKGT